MGGKTTIAFEDGRGKTQTREVNHTIDIREFIGTASYPWLLIFANGHLSVSDIQRLLVRQSAQTPGVRRGPSWIQRRRWMTLIPGATGSSGPKPNADGKDARAVAIMRECPTRSARQLVALLKDQGIARGKDWVLRHRCD